MVVVGSGEGNGTPLQYSCWKIPWTEEPGGLQSIGVAKGRTQLSDFTFTFMHWRRKWQPTPVFLPGESRDGGAWWAAVYGVTQSRTQLKWLSSSSSCWKQWSNSNTCRLYLAKGYKDSQILSFRSTFLQKCFLEGNIKIRHTNKANQHVIVLWRGCDFQAK